MKRWKYMLSVLLVFVLLLSSCREQIPGLTDTEPTTVTEQPGITPAPVSPTTLNLVENGKSEYLIVYGDQASEAIVKAARSLQQAIKDHTGAILLLSPESDTKGGVDAKEIIIGSTTRTESTQLLAELDGYLDYSITAMGNRLVFTGYSDDTIVRSVYYFISQYLKADEDGTKKENLTFSSENNHYFKGNYPMQSLKLFGNPLSNYRLVIPENSTITELRVANYCRYHFGMMTGVLLPIVEDSGTESDYEILIGNTSRTTSTVGKYEYTVTVKSSRIEVLADSLYGYEAALIYMQNQFLTDVRGVESDSGDLVRKDISESLSGGTENILKRSGEFRIMYHNIWGWNESDTNPTDQRNKMLAATYLEYRPDVLCLQECTMMMRNPDKYPIAVAMREAGYEEVPVEAVGGLQTATPILYRKDVLNLIDQGVYKLEIGGGDDKFVTWAVFETKETQKRFAVVSAHLAYQQTAEANEWRVSQVGKITDLVSQLTQQYHCPVITGGDMNSAMGSDPYNTYLNNGFRDVQTFAIKTEDARTNFSYPSFNSSIGMFERPSVSAGSYHDAIDHIFVSGDGLRFDLFDVVLDSYVLCASDHAPLLVDFSFDEYAGSEDKEPITEWTWRY